MRKNKHTTSNQIKRYLSKIGRQGGMKSRRTLDVVTAKNMVRIREARRAYKRYYAQCFWSFNPDYHITLADVTWVGEQLMKNGNMQLWQIGAKLCR